MNKVIADVLLDIAHERNGYSIGEPWRFTEHSLAAVVPLTRETRVESRPYRLLVERKSKVKVTDTGDIKEVRIVNNDEYPILVKAGEVLTGPTQTRTVTISQIILPGEKTPVHCACVYSTKGIREGQVMEPRVYSPAGVRRVIFDGHYSGSKLSGSYCANQQGVWGEVRSAGREYASGIQSLANMASCAGPAGPRGTEGPILEELDAHYGTPIEDLAGRVEETQQKLKSVIEKVPKVDHQVGVALMTTTGLESMEAFEHPDSWEGFRRSFLGAESAKIADVSDENGVFEFRAEKAKDIIRNLLAKDFSEKVAVDRERTQTYILDTDRFVGEVVLLDNSPIHFSFLRKER